MIFVGREKETARLLAALEQGRNVMVTGRYGSGRTTLLRHAAETARGHRRFAFADFGRTPAAICEDLLEGLGSHRGAHRHGRPLRYLALRAALVRAVERDVCLPVLVLDDIARVTAPRAALVRALAGSGRFCLAAVVEGFLPQADRVRLATWLEPACRIVLGPLERSEAARFFARFAADRRTGWSPAEIDGLARASAGYPLTMVELAQGALARGGTT